MMAGGIFQGIYELPLCVTTEKIRRYLNLITSKVCCIGKAPSGTHINDFLAVF